MSTLSASQLKWAHIGTILYHILTALIIIFAKSQFVIKITGMILLIISLLAISPILKNSYTCSRDAK